MTNFPPDDAWVDAVDVNKGTVRSLFSERVPIRVANPAELNSMDTGAAKLFYVATLTAHFIFDPLDTTSPDDGLNLLVSNDGHRYVKETQIVAAAFTAPGVPLIGEEIGPFIFTDPATFPAGLATSRALVRTAPTLQAVFSIQKNLVTFGTITFAALGTSGTFAAASATSFVVGDAMSIIAPNPVDATLAHFSATIRADN